MPKNAEKFTCEICDFVCSKESNYTIHLMTRKHKLLTTTNEKMPKNAAIKLHECSCGKKYKFASSLCYHKKKCNNNKESVNNVCDNNEINELKNIVKDLMKQNNDLIKTIIEITPKIGNTTITNNMNNTNTNNSINNTTTNNNEIKTKVLIVRDPVARFISAFNMMKADVLNNDYSLQNFIDNFPKKSFIICTDYNGNINDIFGNIPSIAPPDIGLSLSYVHISFLYIGVPSLP